MLHRDWNNRLIILGVLFLVGVIILNGYFAYQFVRRGRGFDGGIIQTRSGVPHATIAPNDILPSHGYNPMNPMASGYYPQTAASTQTLSVLPPFGMYPGGYGVYGYVPSAPVGANPTYYQNPGSISGIPLSGTSPGYFGSSLPGVSITPYSTYSPGGMAYPLAYGSYAPIPAPTVMETTSPTTGPR